MWNKEVYAFSFGMGVVGAGLLAASFGQLGLKYDLPYILNYDGMDAVQTAHTLIEWGEKTMFVGGSIAFWLPALIFAFTKHHAGDLKHHD